MIAEDDVENWFEDEEEESVVTPMAPETDLVAKYAESQLRIVRSTIDFSLHTLRTSLSDASYINMAPIYQRRNRWDIPKRSRLIESFLMNIPIPPLFLFENDYNQYEVMDGRQRLETIQSFLNNEFALRGLEFWKELNGYKFNDLSETIQRGLLRRTISAIVLLAETTKTAPSQDFDVRMVLFRRLNTGGIKLNPQEIRNALYPSEFNVMVRNLARDPLFTRLWGIPARMDDEELNPPQQLLRNTLYRTMADSELVLRFYGIKETIEQDLGGSLRRILDRTMERHQNDSLKEVAHHREVFINCLSRLDIAFPDNPFKLPSNNRLSRPLYDALMVAVSLVPRFDPSVEGVQARIRLANALSNQATYDILIGRGNTVEAIKDRVMEAKYILTGVRF